MCGMPPSRSLCPRQVEELEGLQEPEAAAGEEKVGQRECMRDHALARCTQKLF